MANTIGYGQGAVNNTNGFGKAPTNNTIDFGEVCADSWSPETNLTGAGAGFSNTYSTYYDGIDAYIATDATYSELDGDTKATISLWIKPPSTIVDYQVIASVIKNATTTNHQFQILLVTNGTIAISMDSNSKYVRASSTPLTLNAWNHVLFCIDLTQATSANRGRIFINGTDATSAVTLSGALATSTGALNIGQNENGHYDNYEGNLDELAIWSGVDLRSDIATIYNSGVPGNLNDNGLTAPTSWYRFEEGSGTTISDSGSSTNNATIQNSVTFEADVPS